jgi:Fur family transcriptional regulator, ferric uptake regulator
MPAKRNTRQREIILETLSQAEGPLTTQGILERARLELPQLGLATVYRTVALLRDDGRILEVRLPGEEPRFEPVRQTHHHHFSCTRCHRVLELDFCPVQIPKGTLLPNGFRVQDHHLTLYGLCATCDQIGLQA